MLKSFCVENFKGFKEKLKFDLSKHSSYEFNQNIIKNGIINKAMIYGCNGCGKSNLGMAIMDIITHLTDKQKFILEYEPYLNLDSDSTVAKFEYEFLFDNKIVSYSYKKIDMQTLLEEEFKINGKTFVKYDFTTNEGFTKLPGTETLNIISNENKISRIKFIKNNALLTIDENNIAFLKFMDYVDHMLMFYSLDRRGYQGLIVGSGDIGTGIVENGGIKGFEDFLHSQNINLHLIEKEINGKKKLYCKFKNDEVSFFDVASTGTVSLALFYYWFLKMKEASFIFIDEFDAFYHFELSEAVVVLLKDLIDSQVIVTTHNTDLLSNNLLRPDCYFIFKNNNITSLSESTDKELRRAHNLQKLFKSGAFDE